MDNQSATVLVLLDLSAAFDIIDHSVLFDRMENIIGIEGTALNWFRSYLGGAFSENTGWRCDISYQCAIFF